MAIENQSPKAYELENDTGPDIRFTGIILSHASSRRRNSYRWTEMVLYRVQNGKHVIHVIGKTTVEGEETRHDVYIYNSKEDMMRGVRYTSLTARLFERAGFDSITIG